MTRHVAIGIQSFEDIRKNHYFYIDKTSFIKEWWEAGDQPVLCPNQRKKQKDIYNPWSILNFLDTGELTTYWANTSSNALVSQLIRSAAADIKNSLNHYCVGSIFIQQLTSRSCLTVWMAVEKRRGVCSLQADT